MSAAGDPAAELPDRPLPAWFDDAKLGIFVHWTAAAVPAYAPITDSPFDLAGGSGWEEAMRSSPYVEWYWNSISIEGSPAALHHAAHHGDVPYDTFVEQFLDGHGGWSAGRWADLFEAAGARYVVLVTSTTMASSCGPAPPPTPTRRGGPRTATSSASWPTPPAPGACASAPTTRAASTGPSVGCR